MNVSSLDKVGPVKAITIDTPKPMSDTIHSIRHKNAKHILNKHCNGVTKDFAAVLGKAEQQCSNFLRDNAPVKIGPRIAREIEFAFGYADKWLDVEHSADEIESVDPGLVDHLNATNRALKAISSLLFDGVSAEDAFTLNTELGQITDKAERLRRESRNTLYKRLVEQAQRTLKDSGFYRTEVLKEPLFFESGPVLKSDNTLFEIVLNDELPQNQRTLFNFENPKLALLQSWGSGKSKTMMGLHKKAQDIQQDIQYTGYYWLVPFFENKHVNFIFIDRLAVYLFDLYGPNFDDPKAKGLEELSYVMKDEFFLATSLSTSSQVSPNHLAAFTTKQRINTHPKFSQKEDVLLD